MGGGVDGEDNASPRLDGEAAIGGKGHGDSSGAGGSGGARGVDATPGQRALNGGGGGGAVGRVRLRTHAAAPITSAGTVVSPAPVLTTDL